MVQMAVVPMILAVRLRKLQATVLLGEGYKPSVYVLWLVPFMDMRITACAS